MDVTGEMFGALKRGRTVHAGEAGGGQGVGQGGGMVVGVQRVDSMKRVG